LLSLQTLTTLIIGANQIGDEGAEHIANAMRRRIFLAFSLPHFIWLFSTWFLFTEKQQQIINSTYLSGIKIVYGLYGWDDISTLIVSQEKTL